MHDNDHVPTPPPLYGHELNLLVIGDTMAWIPAFVVPAIQNLVIGGDSDEGDYQFQRETEQKNAPDANRCRCCPMWPELLCERPDCRHASSDGDCREGD